jgi:hypothetical protein
LNYLNLQEIRCFCKEHSIPYTIHVETPSGEPRRTPDTDRKSVVLGRIRHYLKTGKVPNATVFAAAIVRRDPIPHVLHATDRLYYGWYDKKNPVMLELLRSLTDGEFRNGAIARILAREFWTAGKAPTFDEYARAWRVANRKGLGYHPEAAFLTDLARNEAGKDWKAKRVRKAKNVLRVLERIEKP